MNANGNCIGCTRDESLRRKLSGWLAERHALTWAEDIEAVGLSLQQHGASILLLDLRSPNAFTLLEWLPRSRPSCVTICFAEARSRPALLAEQLGVTEIQPFEPERKSLQAAVARAAEISSLRMDNAILQAHREPAGIRRSTDSVPGRTLVVEPIANLSRAAQCLDDPEALLGQVVEIVSRTLRCFRASLYLIGEDGKTCRLRAEIGGTGTSPIALDLSSSFPRWLRLQGRIAARTNLARAEGQDERLMLSKALDELNAEAAAPLSGKKGFLGWIAINGPLSGGSLEASDLEALMRLCQELSPPIEKCLNYRSSGLRQKLIEMVFDALPLGVVALNHSLEVIWLNRAAEALLNVSFDNIIGSNLDSVGLGLAELARLSRDEAEAVRHVFRTPSGTPIEIRAETLELDPSHTDPGNGLLVMLQDATVAEELKGQKELSFRRQILSDMASSVAFEIRSPLATIKTFTQLFPERAADPSFARRYRDLVAREVDRLSDLSDSIRSLSDFRPRQAGRPKTIFTASALVELVRCLSGMEWVDVEPRIEENLPSIEGNCARLAECVCHLLANAREATRNQPSQPIKLSISKVNVTANVPALEIAVSDHRVVEIVGKLVDNSHLGSEDDHQRANLRLAFASEIVREFAGDIGLATSKEGVTIKLLLPICCDEETANS